MKVITDYSKAPMIIERFETSDGLLFPDRERAISYASSRATELSRDILWMADGCYTPATFMDLLGSRTGDIKRLLGYLEDVNHK